MMIIITVLLCALTNQVIGQTKEILPTKILAQQKTISENSDLYLSCSTFGTKRDSIIFVYLWKDGQAIKKMIQKQDQDDVTFHISRVGLHHSGNYSCVYSPQNHTISGVTQRGHNIIQILVIANFLPADISLVGPSTVYERDYAEFRCSLSDTLHTLGGCQLIQSYLVKNETILLLQPFNLTRMEVIFTIEGAALRDSGHYSCMVLPSQCIPEHKNTIYGKNTVFLEVKVGLINRVIVFCGLIPLVGILGLCLGCISNKQGYSTFCNPRAKSQQRDADMFQEQRQGVEAHDEEEDSFDMGEEEQYPSNHAAEASTYSDDFDGVYSVASENEAEYDTIDGVCGN